MENCVQQGRPRAAISGHSGACVAHVGSDLRNRMARTGDGRFYYQPTNAHYVTATNNTKSAARKPVTWLRYACCGVLLLCVMVYAAAKRINRPLSLPIYYFHVFLVVRCTCLSVDLWLNISLSQANSGADAVSVRLFACQPLEDHSALSASPN